MTNEDSLMTYKSVGKDSFKGTANIPLGWMKINKSGEGTQLPRAIPVHPDVAKMFADHEKRGLVDNNYKRAVFNTRRKEFIYNEPGAVILYIEPESDIYVSSLPIESMVEPRQDADPETTGKPNLKLEALAAAAAAASKTR